MGDMVDNARKIVLTVQIPVFADADTGYGDAISTHYTVREYIQASIAGAHIEDQTFPPKSGPRRRCISIQEMVGKLRAAMDAKQALDPDFVIMARCDLGGVPGAGFAEIIERCQAYKAEAQVDVICPNGLRTWEEIQEAIRLIPGPVVPLIPAHLSPYPSLQAQQDAGAAAAWFPALTTMAGLQANWDFLSDFRQRGTLALDALRGQAAQSPWGVASNGRILDEERLRSMEEKGRIRALSRARTRVNSPHLAREPTRSQNITVSWRRSAWAGTHAGGGADAGVAVTTGAGAAALSAARLAVADG